MLYWDCFVVGSWMFALGWLLGAIYVQNQNEKPQDLPAREERESCPDCETWRIRVGASAAAD